MCDPDKPLDSGRLLVRVKEASDRDGVSKSFTSRAASDTLQLRYRKFICPVHEAMSVCGWVL